MTEDRIDICRQLRHEASEAAVKAFLNLNRPTETEFARRLNKELKGCCSDYIYSSGWYSPPPMGIGVLFASAESPGRLFFDSLRNPKFWPHSQFCFAENCLGMVYLSPVKAADGTIGDFGLTVYNGRSEKIRHHLRKCLEITENVAEYAQLGMEFRQLYAYAQSLLRENRLTNSGAVAYNDPAGANIGHTIPWTSHETLDTEEAIFEGRNFEAVKELIARRRIFISPRESFKISRNLAYVVELRMRRSNDPAMPNVFFHILVSFKSGIKCVYTGFNQVFKALKMDSYLLSKY